MPGRRSHRVHGPGAGRQGRLILAAVTAASSLAVTAGVVEEHASISRLLLSLPLWAGFVGLVSVLVALHPLVVPPVAAVLHPVLLALAGTVATIFRSRGRRS